MAPLLSSALGLADPFPFHPYLLHTPCFAYPYLLHTPCGIGFDITRRFEPALSSNSNDCNIPLYHYPIPGVLQHHIFFYYFTYFIYFTYFTYFTYFIKKEIDR